MKKMVRNFMVFIAGPKATFELEHRLFNLASFFISLFALIAVFINYFLGLELQTIWLSLTGVLASGVLYHQSRFRFNFSAKIIFWYLFIAVGILGSMYFYNNGMHGTTIYAYLMLLNIVVLIMPRKYQYWVFGILYASIIGLMVLEYKFPAKIVPYHSREEMLLDHILCLFFTMLFTTSTIVSFRRSYYAERGRTMRRNQELKQLNEQMEVQRQALEKAVTLATERRENIETLLNELNHRVKNNLQIVSSLLKLQAQSITDEKAKQAILESRNRLSSMLLVHKRLYLTENITQIYMPDYLRELMESVMQTYQGNLDSEIVTYQVEPVWLKVEKAIPLGLISNELITNCFKHSFTGAEGAKIAVSLAKTGDTHLLTVSDNGPGFTEDSPKGSFGLELVKSLVMQLNATYKIKFENGTCWEIYFN